MRSVLPNNSLNLVCVCLEVMYRTKKKYRNVDTHTSPTYKRGRSRVVNAAAEYTHDSGVRINAVARPSVYMGPSMMLTFMKQ